MKAYKTEVSIFVVSDTVVKFKNWLFPVYLQTVQFLTLTEIQAVSPHSLRTTASQTMCLHFHKKQV